MKLSRPGVLRLHSPISRARARQQAVLVGRPRSFSTSWIFGGRRPLLSLFCSGIVLGVGVTIPIATWYHYSGIKNAVDTAQVTLSDINQAQQNVQSNKPSKSNKPTTPSQSLAFLRVAAKNYVQAVPFAAYAVDKAFDSVEAKIDAHQEEAAVIIDAFGEKMAKIVEHHKSVTVPAAWELLQVVKEETAKLQELASKAVDPSVKESVQRAAGTGLKQAMQTTESVGKGIAGFVKEKITGRKGGNKEDPPDTDEDSTT